MLLSHLDDYLSEWLDELLVKGVLFEYKAHALKSGDSSCGSEDHDPGFDHLIFHYTGPDQAAFLEKVGREVLPKLKELTVP